MVSFRRSYQSDAEEATSTDPIHLLFCYSWPLPPLVGSLRRWDPVHHPGSTTTGLPVMNTVFPRIVSALE